MTASERSEGRGLRTRLRTQLVAHALLSVLLPIAILGGAVFFILTYPLDIVESRFGRSRGELTETVVTTDLVAQAKGITRQIDAFLTERIAEGRAWASADVVVAAALAAHDRHVDEGLIDAPVAAVEKRFQDEKSLSVSPEADAYATSLHAVSGMAERAARGEMVSPAAIEHPEEIVRLNDAVSRLSQAFRAALERDRPRQ